MKVTFISPYYPPFTYGGAEISTSIFIQNLPTEIESAVITSTFKKKGWIQDGVPVVPLLYNVKIQRTIPFGFAVYAIEILLAPLINAIRIFRYLSANPPDIVHIIPSSYVNVGIIFAISRMKIPCVIDIRDFTWVCMSDFSYPNYIEEREGHNCFSHFWKSYKSTNPLIQPFLWLAALYETSVFFLYRSIIRRLVNSSRHMTVSAISSYTKSKLISSGYRADKITVISNILSTYSTVSKKRDKFFVYAGRIEKSKGVWDIIHAFLEATIPEFTLHIFGDGSETKSIVSFLRQNSTKNIVFHGKKPVDEIISAYQNSFAIVSVPIRPEPLGRFLLDSFLTQTPLITSNIGGSAEYIQDRKNGILVAPGDRNQMAEAFRILVNDEKLYNRIRNNLAVLPKQFSTKSILESRLQMYSKIR